MSAPHVVRAERAWLAGRVAHDVVFVLDPRGTILDVRPAEVGDPEAVGGFVVPGLINAHTHLEGSHLAGAVPGGKGFGPWAAGFMTARGTGDAEAAGRAAAQGLFDGGTAAVGDIANGGQTAPWLRDAGLQGTVHHEVLGLGREQRAGLDAAVAQGVRTDGGITVRPSPHALFSTDPEIVAACAALSGPPGTIHVGEAEAEAQFLRDHTGPFADLLDRLGRDWRHHEAPGCGPLAMLDALGALGPSLLLVHVVRIDPAERALAAVRGATVCFCPRSNRHIGGQLPDVPAWLALGVPAALGTDSLASSPDLDVLGEIPVLADAFPDVPAARWLDMATAGGARALGRPDLGRLAPGCRPGLLALDAGGPEDLVGGPVDRRWIVPPAWHGPCDPSDDAA